MKKDEEDFDFDKELQNYNALCQKEDDLKSKLSFFKSDPSQKKEDSDDQNKAIMSKGKTLKIILLLGNNFNTFENLFGNPPQNDPPMPEPKENLDTQPKNDDQPQMPENINFDQNQNIPQNQMMPQMDPSIQNNQLIPQFQPLFDPEQQFFNDNELRSVTDIQFQNQFQNYFPDMPNQFMDMFGNLSDHSMIGSNSDFNPQFPQNIPFGVPMGYFNPYHNMDPAQMPMFDNQNINQNDAMQLFNINNNFIPNDMSDQGDLIFSPVQSVMSMEIPMDMPDDFQDVFEENFAEPEINLTPELLSQFPIDLNQIMNSLKDLSLSDEPMQILQQIQPDIPMPPFVHRLEELFMNMLREILNHKIIKIRIYDLKKSSFFNYDLGYYSLPENYHLIKYKYLTLVTNFTRLPQLLAFFFYLYELGINGGHATKREIYYRDVNLFGNMVTIDTLIHMACLSLEMNRFELPIYPSAKGLFCGNMLFLKPTGEPMNLISMTDTGDYKANLITVDYINSNYSINLQSPFQSPFFILVLEKDTVFTSLNSNRNFHYRFPNCTLLTGKGYPDYLTKLHLQNISKKLPQLPIIYLGDNDPYGYEIFLNYSFGAVVSTLENEFISTNKMMWLPWDSNTMQNIINSTKLDELSGKGIGLIPLKEKDITRIDSILSRPYFDIESWQQCNNPFKEIIIRNISIISDELSQMKDRKYKAEVEFILGSFPNIIFDQIENVLNTMMFPA
ncbi:MAG: hypothetical protein MJ252_12640 [archaeon]|nr:hypothetical protein [archaeon]